MIRTDVVSEDLMACYDRIIEAVEPDFRTQVSRTLGILYSAEATIEVEGTPMPFLHSIFFYHSGKEGPFESDFVLQEKVWKQDEIQLVLETSTQLKGLLFALGISGYEELKHTLLGRFASPDGYRQIQAWLQSYGIRYYSDVMDYHSESDGIY